MQKVAVLGIDLGKNSCSLAGLDASGAVVLRRRTGRQCAPAPPRCGAPGHLDPEHEADAVEPDLGDEALEPRPDLGGGAGPAEVVVDDHDPLAGPAELLGASGQGVLEPSRLGTAADLLQGRLSDVDDGEP